VCPHINLEQIARRERERERERMMQKAFGVGSIAMTLQGGGSQMMKK
jgi:hypothetical protein